MSNIMYINSNNNWELSDFSNQIIYTKTLKTANTFVDRDIELNISVKEGSVVLPQENYSVTPTIKYINDKDIYSVEVENNFSITPQTTSGWIDNVSNGIVYISGHLNLESTKLNSNLIEDSTQKSGYSSYRTIATKGYNGEELFSDIDVYQGNII